AHGIVDVGQIAHWIVRVDGRAFGHAPAIAQATVGIVGVAQDFGARLIEFVGHAAIPVVIPFRRLVLAIGEREQIASGVVGVADDFIVGIGFDDFPHRLVV